MTSLRAAFCALAALTLPVVSAAQTQERPTPPPGLAFYEAPQELLAGEHGSVIWSRPLTGVAALEYAQSNELVLYRSTSVKDNAPIGVSGIIALPKGTPPKGGWPIVTWAHGTLGGGDKCAPSRDERGAIAHWFNQAPHRLLNRYLKRGWAVVMSDYEGLGTPGSHPFLLGKSEARGVLDIVLAARELHPELSDKFIIVGHSQGGQAALFAAAEAPTWTPKLKLLGVNALAPASHIRLLFAAGLVGNTPSPGAAFTALFLSGAKAGSDAVKVEDLLGPEALARFPQVDEFCRTELSENPESWGELVPNTIMRNPKPAALLALNAQLEAMHPGTLTIKVPVRIVQGLADERVVPLQTQELKKDLVNKGARVEYLEYPESDHFGVIEDDITASAAWLRKRLLAK